MDYHTLESARLLFRPFQEQDLEAVYGWLSDPECMKYRSSEPKSLTEARDYLTHAMHSVTEEPCVNYRYAVVRKDTGVLIGSCELYYTDQDPAWLAWELHRDHWRQGFGTEIGERLLELGFGEMGMRRIVADCLLMNEGSWRIMERIGMRQEALFRQSSKSNSLLGHTWCDRVQYGMLRQEWLDQRAELRPLSEEDGDDVYALLQSIPAEENGFMNGAAGLSRVEFAAWLKKQAANARKTEIEDGWKVPQGLWWLYVCGKPVGMAKLRYFLTDALRASGGHLGYAISPAERGRGYAPVLVQRMKAVALSKGIDRMLVTVHNDNEPSIRTALRCGGVIERIGEERHYIWLDCHS